MSDPHVIAAAVAALAGSAVMLAGVKVRASSVYLHHATHGRLYAHRGLNRWVGEFAGILSLSMGFDEYRRIHGLHHGHKTFAQARTDEEAAGLLKRGFKPGRSRRALKSLFLWTPFDPVWHMHEAWARLKANFAMGPTLRRAAAWGYWGGLGALAVAGGWLPGLLGSVALLLVSGSVASYLELISRHRWNIEPPSTGRQRQFDLSHWRLPTPWLPEETWTVRAALRFTASVMLKSLWRFVVVPETSATTQPTTWAGTPARPRRGRRPKWADAALSYSDALRSDPMLHPHVFGDLMKAVDVGLDALEAARTHGANATGSPRDD